MNRWHGLLGVAAVCAAALASGAYAAEAQRCKLELVRLEPLRPGAPLDATDASVRNVRPQSFFWLRKGDEFIMGPNRTEDDGERVIKQEPKKYVAKSPLRGVAKLGSKLYGFVLDYKDKDSKRYDRLYFDRNGNGDLTDDKPIDANPPVKPIPPNVATNYPIGFPRVDLGVEVDGKKYDCSFFFYADTSGDGPNTYVSAWLTSAAYRRGEITLDGKKQQIVLLDNNSNGRFDDVCSIPQDIHGAEGQLYPEYGDLLLIDLGKAAPSALQSLTSRGPGEHFLCKVNMLGGKFYEFKVSPAGDELTCTPVATRVGKITSPHAPCTVELGGDQGIFSVALEKSRPAEVPAGRWRLLSYTITVKDWKPLVKHKAAKPREQDPFQAGDGASLVGTLAKALLKAMAAPVEPMYGPADVCTVSARGTKDAKPISVEEGKTATLEFGPPYKCRVTVVPTPETAHLGLALVGSGGEVVSNLVLNGRRPAKPKLTITGPKDKVVVRGDFEYG